ncbi:MAG: tetratricopeptide repeat protein [candidate division Zixibacteria bacterium]|nr:tetratricopeptide repeat protein [candidate division Zixibacteria bacterium]
MFELTYGPFFTRNMLSILTAISIFLIILTGCGAKPDPVRFESFRERGIRLMVAGEYDKAVREFRKALKIDDKDSRLYISMAECFEQLNESDSAVTYYEGAIIFNPGDSNPYQIIGDIYFENQDYDEAMAWYDRAQQIGYLKPGSYIKLAKIHQNWNQFDFASQYYTLAVAIDSSNIDGFYGLGLMKLMAADTVMAEYNFLEAITKGPHARAAYRLGLIRAERKHYDEAIKYLDQCAQLEPDSDLGRQAYQRRIEIIMKMKAGQE